MEPGLTTGWVAGGGGWAVVGWWWQAGGDGLVGWWQAGWQAGKQADDILVNFEFLKFIIDVKKMPTVYWVRVQ